MLTKIGDFHRAKVNISSGREVQLEHGLLLLCLSVVGKTWNRESWLLHYE